MSNMMQQCWNWMMSLGAVGMLLGIAVLVSLLVLAIVAIKRLTRDRSGNSTN